MEENTINVTPETENAETTTVHQEETTFGDRVKGSIVIGAAFTGAMVAFAAISVGLKNLFFPRDCNETETTGE